MRNVRWLKEITAGVLVTILILVTSGCSLEEDTPKHKGNLKIAVSSKGNYEYLYQDYIQAAFPDLKVSCER